MISYSSNQPFIVAAVASTEAGFESALSIGDTILWSFNGGAQSHNITNNVP